MDPVRAKGVHLRYRPGRRGVGRRTHGGAKTGKLAPALFIVPTDTEGFTYTQIPMELQNPEKQFQLFFDDVRLPGDALVGGAGGGAEPAVRRSQPGADHGCGVSDRHGPLRTGEGRRLRQDRTVWKTPIGAHQAIAHPLAAGKVELEMAKLMMQKAATLYDAGDDWGRRTGQHGQVRRGEASTKLVDQAVHTLGGNGLTSEYGLAPMLALVRIAKVAPVSREMILNFVAQTSLGLPKSY